MVRLERDDHRRGKLRFCVNGWSEFPRDRNHPLHEFRGPTPLFTTLGWVLANSDRRTPEVGFLQRKLAALTSEGCNGLSPKSAWYNVHSGRAHSLLVRFENFSTRFVGEGSLCSHVLRAACVHEHPPANSTLQALAMAHQSVGSAVISLLRTVSVTHSRRLPPQSRLDITHVFTGFPSPTNAASSRPIFIQL